ncbi:MAG: hypothetical protein ACKVOT_10925 [Polaromonas sp.]
MDRQSAIGPGQCVWPGLLCFWVTSAEKSGLVGSHRKNSENTRFAESIWPPRLTSLSNDHVPHLPGL